MPVATALKVEALSEDFRSQRRLAEALGVSPAQVSRWKRGQGIDPDNAERLDLLELAMSFLLRLYRARDGRALALRPESPPAEPPSDRRDQGGGDAGGPRGAASGAGRVVRVILFRCFPWDRSVDAESRGGALWFPRMLQGDGRHDAPQRYGCLYVSEEPLSTVVEQLAPLVGTKIAAPDLVRGGLPLALAALELPDGARLLNLDEPLVLAAEKLRPSLLATHERATDSGGREHALRQARRTPSACAGGRRSSPSGRT